MPTRRVVSFLFVLAAGLALAAAPLAAQTIKIGEINTYSGIAAPFTGPYRQGVELALEEVNARGGLLGGRKVEIVFRDDKGQPAEAVKHAQELVESEKVALIAGTFLSNVGLAVSDWAKQNKTLFVAAEPLTEAITWSKGHRHVVRVRPNTYEQGRMLAEEAGRLPHKKWATIGPNYEYGKRAWETFWERLKQLKPDAQNVGEHWPTLGKLEPGAFVAAIMNQQPEALYVSLFGSDWIAFAREATKRGLFEKMFVVGILLGEPEYIDPLKTEAPEKMLVTGYPWYDMSIAAHTDYVARYQKTLRQAARAGLARRLRHVPLGVRGHPQGGQRRHREADRRVPEPEGGDADRPHHLPRLRRPVHDGRVGRLHEGRPEAGRRRHGQPQVRAGREGPAVRRGGPEAPPRELKAKRSVDR